MVKIECFSGVPYITLGKHPQDVLMLSERSFGLKPNTKTAVGIESIELTRLESPFPSECVATWEDTTFAGKLPQEYTNLDYSQVVRLTSILLSNRTEKIKIGMPETLLSKKSYRKLWLRASGFSSPNNR